MDTQVAGHVGSQLRQAESVSLKDSLFSHDDAHITAAVILSSQFVLIVAHITAAVIFELNRLQRSRPICQQLRLWTHMLC